MINGITKHQWYRCITSIRVAQLLGRGMYEIMIGYMDKMFIGCIVEQYWHGCRQHKGQDYSSRSWHVPAFDDYDLFARPKWAAKGMLTMIESSCGDAKQYFYFSRAWNWLESLWRSLSNLIDVQWINLQLAFTFIMHAFMNLLIVWLRFDREYFEISHEWKIDTGK